MGKYELIATAALLCNFSSFGTLLYNVMTTHNTSTLTYAWFYTNILAQVLMIIYAVLNGAYGIYIPTTFLVIGLLYMLYIKSTFNDCIFNNSYTIIVNNNKFIFTINNLFSFS